MRDEIIECGNKLYYDINPNSKMDVPSYFYEKLEKVYVTWRTEGSNKDFYEYCKHKYVKV